MSYCINPKCPHPAEPLNANSETCCHCGSDLLLQGRYRVVRFIGEGGFGKTFEVDDGGKPKVLKVLSNQDQKAVDLFQQEAKVLSQLRHPGIPKVEAKGYFTFQPKDSTEPLHCLVMEKIEGVNLLELLRKRSYKPISQAQAIAWLKQLTIILGQVHQQQYFHRDIKPTNIMLRNPSISSNQVVNKRDQLVLIDFGTAREVSSTYLARIGGGHQVTGLVSAGYTPPEQVDGRAVPQSDFYALGRTFVHLLTGRPPNSFAEDSQGNLLWHNGAKHVSKPLVDLINYLMAPLPGNRPQDTKEILHYLEKIENYFKSPASLSIRSQTATPTVRDQSKTGQNISSEEYSNIMRLKIRTVLLMARLIFGSFGILSLLKLCNPQTGQPKNTLTESFSHVNSITIRPLQKRRSKTGGTPISQEFLEKSISPDGWIFANKDSIAEKQIGSTIPAGMIDTIELWNLQTRELLRTMPVKQQTVSFKSTVAISPDSQTLASFGFYDGTIELWNLQTGLLQTRLKSHFGRVKGIAFTPDSKTLVSSSYDGNIEFWRVQ